MPEWDEFATTLAARDARVVIVGAGLAGVQAAAALRKAGYEGGLFLVGAEPHRPYDRPPLSKQVLLEAEAEARIALRPPAFYEENRIELILGRKVAMLDRAARRAILEDGAKLDFTALVIATGSELKPLPFLPQGSEGVFYLRTFEDSLALRAALASGSHLAIIGAGVIGLEVAAAATQRGATVTVIEAAPRVMARCTSPLVGQAFARRHAEQGVALHGAAQLVEAERSASGWRLHLGDGASILTDAIAVGIGVVPALALACAAGLETVPSGIVTDGYGRTSDPAIFAAGEVAWHWNGWSGRHERQENWFHAAAHGEHVGRSMLAIGAEYCEPGGYWTDQYDLHLQTVGHTLGEADIVRGERAAGKFIIYHLAGDRIIGASALNAPRELRTAKALVRARAQIDPSCIADSSFDLSRVAA